MKIQILKSSSTALLFGVAALLSALSASAEFPWQESQANVLPNGDIEWAPRPYEFVAGETLRYIDFENGDDANDGSSKAAAWKHHPWDANATRNAAAHEGVTTYVFKGGVDYRGILVADESGEPGNPIRLARDPSWGEGPARILGSTRLPAAWVKASTVDHPARLPEVDQVWAIDMGAAGLLNEQGRPKLRAKDFWHDTITEPWYGLFRVDADDRSHAQHLARTPDWQQGNINFPLDYWHSVDDTFDEKNPEKPDARAVRVGIQDEWLKGHPRDYFEGGYLWPQYALFMGGPTARKIESTMKSRGHEFPQYRPEEGVIFPSKFGSWGANLRYMIDNLPQFLDSPEEFYFDPETGFLFYRPLEGVQPNEQHLEWAMIDGGVNIESQSHIEIAGLDFRYQNSFGVSIENNAEDILVRHCRFEDMLQFGVSQQFKNWRSDEDKETGEIIPRYADQLRVHDCYFQDIWETAVRMAAGQEYDRVLGHVELLRSKTLNTGIRHKDNIQTPLPAVEIMYPKTGIIAGNIIDTSWGSGLMIFAGISSGSSVDWPLSRLLVYENKTVDTALAVNDYGGMSLWQGGSIYCYNNIIGNSPGVMPAGILFGGRGSGEQRNLSYPLYLDGAYKVFSFNNIIWARHNDPEKDEFATKTPGYFMVFGFLNHFVNNTLYRTGEGVGGSAGNRNDVVGNLMAEVGDESRLGGRKPNAFIAHDRAGDPSLVGGGDDGSSGRVGVPTLAYANNVFHGEAIAGQILRENPEGGFPVGIEGKTVEELSAAMAAFPIRYAQLGWETTEKPIAGKSSPEPILTLDEVDFRPLEGSMAIDKGATYFVPWSLHGTVGEWHFAENQAEPDRSIDYAWYQSEAHYDRSIYPYVPPLDLVFNQADLETYTEGELEDWCKGAMTFDGERFARVPDAKMREDIVVPIYRLHRRGELVRQNHLPGELDAHWVVPDPIKGKGTKAEYETDATYSFPGEHRKTLISNTDNLLVEAVLRSETPGGGILGKFDGESGYRLYLDDVGKAVFEVASEGKTGSVATAEPLTDGQWRHLLAEIDRDSGAMRIYVDGKLSAEAASGLPADASLNNQADFHAGKTLDGKFFVGEMDFMRVAHGTLADAKTSIEELYAWQTDGPFKRDMRGQKPVGRRDAGALEHLN